MFFVLGAQDAVDGVRGAAAGFVVVADLHFAEQADGEQVQASEQQAERSHHQRAVRLHDRNVAEKLFHAKPGHDAAAAHDADHADRPEEVQRARQIAQQEANRQQIEEDAEGAGDSIV